MKNYKTENRRQNILKLIEKNKETTCKLFRYIDCISLRIQNTDNSSFQNANRVSEQISTLNEELFLNLGTTKV